MLSRKLSIFTKLGNAILTVNRNESEETPLPSALVNGVHIHYESYGQGFPLVFAYGLGGNTTEWASQIPAFSKHYRFIVWDPRGHGQSDSPPNLDQYGSGTSAYDLLALLDHLGIEKAYVGGLSMGGGIATRLAMLYPGRVEALLVIDSASASGLPTSEAALRMRNRIVELTLSHGMEAVADYAIKHNPNISRTAQSGPEGEKAIREMYRALDPVGYAHSSKATTVYASFDPDLLKQIRVPTLVLSGSEDPALEACKLIHEKIEGSQLRIIPNAGHLSNLDQPEAFNRAILEFLETVDAQRLSR